MHGNTLCSPNFFGRKDWKQEGRLTCGRCLTCRWVMRPEWNQSTDHTNVRVTDTPSNAVERCTGRSQQTTYVIWRLILDSSSVNPPADNNHSLSLPTYKVL